MRYLVGLKVMIHIYWAERTSSIHSGLGKFTLNCWFITLGKWKATLKQLLLLGNTFGCRSISCDLLDYDKMCKSMKYSEISF